MEDDAERRSFDAYTPRNNQLVDAEMEFQHDIRTIAQDIIDEFDLRVRERYARHVEEHPIKTKKQIEDELGALDLDVVSYTKLRDGEVTYQKSLKTLRKKMIPRLKMYTTYAAYNVYRGNEYYYDLGYDLFHKGHQSIEDDLDRWREKVREWEDMLYVFKP